MSESWQHSKDRIAGYYSKLVAEHGHDPRACDYGRSSSQTRKFAVLAEVMPLNNCSVLDVGCGFADFWPFLKERFAQVTYTGVDITPKMIAEASKLHDDAELVCTDILTESFDRTFDLVTANGIFYLLGAEGEPMMQQLVTRMFELSNTAVAFNSLSTQAREQEPEEFYADPADVLTFCLSLTSKVVVRHDYLQHDFTVYLYK